MKRVYLSFIGLFIFVFVSCTSVNIDSVKNEETYVSECSNVAVFANVSDISLRKVFEEKTVKQLIQYGKNADSSINYIPPVKDYTDEEIKEKLISSNFDSVLIYSFTDTGEKYEGSVLFSMGSGLFFSTPSYSSTVSIDAAFYNLRTDSVAVSPAFMRNQKKE